tara:strand:- start:388 stop:714 length:327 start_codon:yes stop_codon:yes gene_type:complete
MSVISNASFKIFEEVHDSILWRDRVYHVLLVVFAQEVTQDPRQEVVGHLVELVYKIGKKLWKLAHIMIHNGFAVDHFLLHIKYTTSRDRRWRAALEVIGFKDHPHVLC